LMIFKSRLEMAPAYSSGFLTGPDRGDGIPIRALT
jgi:hypothetical protein